jgi:hypothetical protein
MADFASNNLFNKVAKKFIRKIEDFVCEHCGKKTKGNGYTNHCPHCLYSRHVDNYPGDRENPCGGLMEPVGLELEKHVYHIVHQCQTCNARARCKSSPEDNIDALTALSESLAKKLLF